MALMGDDNHDDVIARLNRTSAEGKAKIAASRAHDPASGRGSMSNLTDLLERVEKAEGALPAGAARVTETGGTNTSGRNP